MEKNTEKTVKTQGVQTVRTGEAKEAYEAGTIKAGSNSSQTIKSFGNAVKNLKKNKMIKEEEYETLKNMYSTVLQRWIGGNIFE